MVELPRKEAFESVSNSDDAATASEEPNVRAILAVPPRRFSLKKGILALAVIAVVGYGAHFGHHYWAVGRFIESTDNAYVKADYTTVAPKIAGYVKEVLVDDNDVVKAGQVLARIDDRDFQVALSQARAELKASDAEITNFDAQIGLQQSIIRQAEASVDASNASLVFAKSEARRNTRLSNTGAGTQSRAEQSRSLMDQATAAVQREQAALIAARDKVPVLRSQRDHATAQRDRAVAAIQQAVLNLSYTNIVAAVDGTLGARSVRVGQYVTAGTQLMAVVPLHSVYVVANFKETQLTYVRPGQPVVIEVDGFPGLEVKGYVDSVSPASGLEFSLLPPDNATGNFTKIVQRIPVKIIIDDDARAAQLRSGMSVVAKINTRIAWLSKQE